MEMENSIVIERSKIDLNRLFGAEIIFFYGPKSPMS